MSLSDTKCHEFSCCIAVASVVLKRKADQNEDISPEMARFNAALRNVLSVSLLKKSRKVLISLSAALKLEQMYPLTGSPIWQ